MAEFKNLALTGEMIEKMPEAERWFEIVEEPRYESLTSFNDPSKKVEKLLLHVKLSNGNSVDYFPNTRSSRIIAKSIGTDMSKWKATKWFWGKILKQLVGQSGEKDVLYITSEYPPIHSVK